MSSVLIQSVLVQVVCKQGVGFYPTIYLGYNVKPCLIASKDAQNIMTSIFNMFSNALSLLGN